MSTIDLDKLLIGSFGDWLKTSAVERRKKWRIILWSVFGSILLMFGVAAFGAFVVKNSWPIIGALFIPIFGAMFALSVFKRAVGPLKTDMNSALAGEIGASYESEPKADRGYALARAYQMLPRKGTAKLEDAWRGDVDQLQFILYEAHISQTRSSGSNHSGGVTTLFRGPILRFASRLKLNATVIVELAGLRASFFGSSKDLIKLNDEELRRISLPDSDEQRKFDVYAADAGEARGLITPAYCECLRSLTEQLSGRDLRILFHQNEIVVTMQTGTLFESAALNPAKDRARLERTVDQLDGLLAFVTDLNHQR